MKSLAPGIDVCVYVSHIFTARQHSLLCRALY